MSILHFTLDKYMYNTKFTDWRTAPGVLGVRRRTIVIGSGSTRFASELQSDASPVTSCAALLVGVFNCIWRDVHTERSLGKKQPTHIVRGINHLVTRACVMSSVV